MINVYKSKSEIEFSSKPDEFFGWYVSDDYGADTIEPFKSAKKRDEFVESIREKLDGNMIKDIHDSSTTLEEIVVAVALNFYTTNYEFEFSRAALAAADVLIERHNSALKNVFREGK